MFHEPSAIGTLRKRWQLCLPDVADAKAGSLRFNKRIIL